MKPIRHELTHLFSSLMEERHQKGLATYGTTLDEAKDLDYDWDQMLIEELLDALQYQQKEIRRLKALLAPKHTEKPPYFDLDD
jgi:hypothetical protein